MRKIKIALLITGITTLVSAQPYIKIRDSFKKQLYQGQKGLMSYTQYSAHIEPFLQEAEQSLEIIKYCKQNPEFTLKKDYFNCLQNYIGYDFNIQMKAKASNKKTLNLYANNLLQMIQKIKDTEHLESLDIQEEFNKTAALIHKANTTYYSKLKAHKKLWLSFWRRINWNLFLI